MTVKLARDSHLKTNIMLSPLFCIPCLLSLSKHQCYLLGNTINSACLLGFVQNHIVANVLGFESAIATKRNNGFFVKFGEVM